MVDRSASPPSNSLLFSTYNLAELDVSSPPLTPRLRTIPLPLVSPFNAPLSLFTQTVELAMSSTKDYGLEPSLSPLSTSPSEHFGQMTLLRSQDSSSEVALPIEITHMILRFIASSEYSSPDFHSHMLPLRAVCKGWRTVIDNSFSFWKAVGYDDNRSKRHTRDFQHRILSLHSSETAFAQYLAPFNKHLFIKIQDWQAYDATNLSMAVDLIPMCRNLHFSLPDDSTAPNMIPLEKIGHHRGRNVTVATLLSALSIHPDVRSFTWERGCPLEESLPTVMIPKDLFSMSPSSDAMRPIMPHHWPCMTDLTLKCSLSVAICVDALDRFQDTLESVTFDLIDSDGGTITLPHRPFTLPCLSDMKITIKKPSVNFGPLFTGAIFLAPGLRSLDLRANSRLTLFADVDLHPSWISIALLTFRDVSHADGTKWLQTCSNRVTLAWHGNSDMAVTQSDVGDLHQD